MKTKSKKNANLKKKNKTNKKNFILLRVQGKYATKQKALN